MAFRDLRHEGIVARMSFSCCMTCASSELSELNKPAVYFHKQDNENLKEYGEVDIRYQTPEDDEDATRALGEKAKLALMKHGLVVEWNGNPNTTLTVKGLVTT